MIRGKPTGVDAFLEAGASASAEAKSKGAPSGSPPAAAAVPDDKIAKTIRISKALNQVLKREAFEREQAEGRRVTESDLIDAALRQYFKI